MTNCGKYPRGEAPAVYEEFGEVLNSVEQAGLARMVAKLKPRHAIKDVERADD